MKIMKPITFLLIIIATCATVFFVKALKTTSVGAFVFFSVWLILPYATMSAALIFLQHKGKETLHWYVVATIISTGGILFLTDVIFWHPDAEGGIAVLMTPILQVVALVLLLPVVLWVSRNAST
jgi:hypothetical protein